jgi:hypothetical protein
MNDNDILAILIDTENTRSLIQRVRNYGETSRLIDYFEQQKNIRELMYIKSEELEKILRWKLGRQNGRTISLRELNNNDLIISISQFAFNITHKDIIYKDELRRNAFTLLRGVGVRVSSAVWALIYPDEYCVFDRLVKNIFFPDDNREDIKLYTHEYLPSVRRAAERLHLSPQKIDLSLWQYAMENRV